MSKDKPILPDAIEQQNDQAQAALARIEDNGWESDEQIQQWKSDLAELYTKLTDSMQTLVGGYQATFVLLRPKSAVWQPGDKYRIDGDWAFYDNLRREQARLSYSEHPDLLAARGSIADHLDFLTLGASAAKPEEVEEARLVLQALSSYMEEHHQLLTRWNSLLYEIEQQASDQENAEARAAARKALGLA